MTTIRTSLAAGARKLREAYIPDAARDARLLMAHALGIEIDRLSLFTGDEIDPTSKVEFERLIRERSEHRPVSQIIGRRTFWGLDLVIDGSVLDPRPETETLVAAALAGPAPKLFLDLGTGSGAILLALLSEWPDAHGVGADFNFLALRVALENAQRVGVRARATFVETSWWSDIEGRFDLVVSNPPYISEKEYWALPTDVRGWERQDALTPGPTGLEAYDEIAARLSDHLVPGGRALFEIGPTQGQAVSTLLAAWGFPGARIHPDLDGRDRVVEVRASV